MRHPALECTQRGIAAPRGRLTVNGGDADVTQSESLATGSGSAKPRQPAGPPVAERRTLVSEQPAFALEPPP